MTNISSKKRFRLNSLRLLVAFSLCPAVFAWANGEYIQFNTDVLDVADRQNVDLSKFARAGYVMPGNYSLVIHVNRGQLREMPVRFVVPDNDPDGSVPCLTREIVDLLGLKENLLPKLHFNGEGQCLDIAGVEGMETRADLGTSSLYISIPQAWLEYTAENWDPPSRWDDGIPGTLLDYSFNAQSRTDKHGNDSSSLSGNGTAGFNLGAWRFRGDWQSNNSRSQGTSDASFDWSRYYAFRALPQWRSTLTVGEDYLNSDLFDTLRFTGASLHSDDSMLPPNLRGYAPEVTGVAKTNTLTCARSRQRAASLTPCKSHCRRGSSSSIARQPSPSTRAPLHRRKS